MRQISFFIDANVADTCTGNRLSGGMLICFPVFSLQYHRAIEQ